MPDAVEIEYGEVVYKSLKGACEAAGFNDRTVRSFMRNHGVSAQEALNRYVGSGMKKPRGFWTEERDNVLREKYPTKGANIEELLALTTAISIRSRAAVLGITKVGQLKRSLIYMGTSYSKDQVRKLFSLSTTTLSDVSKSRDCTEQEALDFIVSCTEIAPDGSIKKLADRFGREESYYVHADGKRWSLSIYCREHGLDTKATLLFFQRTKCSADEAVAANKVTLRNEWTSEEDAVLRRITPNILANVQKLLPNRSGEAIRGRAAKLGVIVYANLSGAPGAIIKHIEDVQRAALAFTSENSELYLFLRCGVCGSTILCSLENALKFTHGSMCADSVPPFVNMPRSL